MLDLFVYGTLRPNCELAYLLEQSYAAAPRLAVVDGTLHYHHSHGYPVFVPSTNGEVTTGHLLRLVEDADACHVVMMELSAGYDARWLRIYDTHGKRLTQDGTALVFAWPDYEPVGAHVIGNDWSLTLPLAERVTIAGSTADPDERAYWMNTIPGVPAWI